jgi:hypothetical protein
MQFILDIISILNSKNSVETKIDSLGTITKHFGNTSFIHPKNDNIQALSVVIIENKIVRIIVKLQDKIMLKNIKIIFGDISHVGFNRIDEEVFFNLTYSNCKLSFIVPGNYLIKDNCLYNGNNLINDLDVYVERININAS